MNEDIRIRVLETPRLILRPPLPDDAEQLTELLQDPTIAAWTSSIPFPYSIDDAKSFIASRAEADATGESFGWAMVERSSGQVAGTVGLHDLNRQRGRAELGYWIGERFRGKGYTTEAARRVLSWAFEEAEFERIQATYLPGNEGSAGVMRNIGMQPEGLLRGYGFKDGEHFDLYLQAVLRKDNTWWSTDRQMGSK